MRLSEPKDLLWFLCLMMMTTSLVRAVVKALALEIKVMALELSLATAIAFCFGAWR